VDFPMLRKTIRCSTCALLLKNELVSRVYKYNKIMLLKERGSFRLSWHEGVKASFKSNVLHLPNLLPRKKRERKREREKKREREREREMSVCGCALLTFPNCQVPRSFF